MRISVPGLIIGLLLASLIGFALLPSRLESLGVRPEPREAPPEEGRPEASEPRVSDWPAALAHHNFILYSFDGRELPEKDPESVLPGDWINLSFGQWPEVTGRLCNLFRGRAEVTAEGRLKIFAAATRMMCLEESLNNMEIVFHQITSRGAEFSLSSDGRVLTISGDGHILVFHLRDHVD
jgi:heat shock protein HslJ